MGSRNTLRRALWAALESKPKYTRSVSFYVQTTIIAVILASIAAVMLESVEPIYARHKTLFLAFDRFSVAVFAVEYVIRLWSCVEDKRWNHPFWGRLKYATSFMAIIDFLAVAPFIVHIGISSDFRLIRAIRLIRIFRIFKLGRYSESMQTLARVIRSKREDLTVTVFVVFILMIISSSLMYFAEHNAQPETFCSIPHTMWWTVVTLTTVGYGDCYPVTTAGRIIGGLIALFGVALFAMPTAILGSGFMEEMQRKRSQSITCPHCGKDIDSA